MRPQGEITHDRTPLLTIKQVAEYLGVTELTVRRWAYDGILSHGIMLKLAGVLRFDAEASQAFIDEQKSISTKAKVDEQSECESVL